jgi:hypothetical protein
MEELMGAVSRMEKLGVALEFFPRWLRVDVAGKNFVH